MGGDGREVPGLSRGSSYVSIGNNSKVRHFTKKIINHYFYLKKKIFFFVKLKIIYITLTNARLILESPTWTYPNLLNEQ